MGRTLTKRDFTKASDNHTPEKNREKLPLELAVEEAERASREKAEKERSGSGQAAAAEKNAAAEASETRSAEDPSVPDGPSAGNKTAGRKPETRKTAPASAGKADESSGKAGKADESSGKAGKADENAGQAPLKAASSPAKAAPQEPPETNEPDKNDEEKRADSETAENTKRRASASETPDDDKTPSPSQVRGNYGKRRRKNPPPDYLRSTPPQQSKATFLPQPDPSVRDSEIKEPINSSNNETIAGLARADRASSKAFSKPPRATRSGRAARSAGLDMSEEYRSRGKFRQSLALARKQHPFIMDRPLQITDEEAYELIEKLRAVPLYQLRDASLDINAEESKRLFHALLLTNDRPTVQAIQQLAVQRAGWSLYTIGWSTLQRNFPHRRIQQTLELVYNTLESDPSRSEVRPSYMRKAIGDIINLGKSDAGLVSDVVRHLNQAYNVAPDEGLESFLDDYQILIETPFGGSVLGDFFRRADLPVLYRKKDILCDALPYMHPALAAEVVSRVIASRDDIEGDKKYIYKQVAEIFLHSQPNHPMWLYMSTDLQRAYKSWYIDDRLESQTAMYPGKREFLQTYSEDIEDVAMLSNDLMAIRFDDFILIDDRRRGDSCIYYDDETVKDLLLKGLDEKDLGNPGIPARDVKEAVNAERSRGVVRLSFTRGALTYSRRFMDRLLGHSDKRRRENILKNWFR